jgi:hypothetical protein
MMHRQPHHAQPRLGAQPRQVLPEHPVRAQVRIDKIDLVISG